MHQLLNSGYLLWQLSQDFNELLYTSVLVILIWQNTERKPITLYTAELAILKQRLCEIRVQLIDNGIKDCIYMNVY